MNEGRSIFAAVADDDTGATDLAGMLADGGLRTVLLIDIPEAEDYDRWTAGQDAVIVGVGTRAIAPAEAYERTRAAVRLLNGGDPAMLEVKYCSTFDSTAEGNIGCTIEAAMDEMGQGFTIALPALPVNGRTTYMGYHFVHQQLLSESPMRNHPLNPMREPHLVRHLQKQTRRKVGLAAHPLVGAGIEALRDEFARLRGDGVEIAVVDCISDGDLATISEAAAEMRLITGSSAPAMKLPEIWRRRGLWEQRRTKADNRRGAPAGSGFLIVAGSCSEATRRQNQCAESTGARVYHVDAEALLSGYDDTRLLEKVTDDLRADRTCLVTTSEDAEGVRRVQAAGREAGLSTIEAGLKITGALAGAALRMVTAQQPKALLVAGGETAGAICRQLGLGALRVGRSIQPGVPLCWSMGRFQMPVILKSGNFGGPDFYERARRAAIG